MSSDLDGVKIKSPGEVPASYYCPHCKKLLRDTVQTSDGDRLCELCFEEISRMDNRNCPDCGITVNPAQCFKDLANRKDISRLVVLCDNEDRGCQWTGQLCKLKEHLEVCEVENAGSSPRDSSCDNARAEASANLQLTRRQQVPIQDDRSDIVREARKQIPSVWKELKGIYLSILARETSFNGKCVWIIRDVQRRIQEAKSGRVVSLYSSPFYTGQMGYKLCLKCYLNGDGIGNGQFLSLFIVIMKGEYDDLLVWPFDSKVSLMLIDQDRNKHVVQTFKPSPSSSSFHRPKTDMNVASGCPQFAPLDVLQNTSYVRDDVLFIMCNVDAGDITNPM